MYPTSPTPNAVYSYAFAQVGASMPYWFDGSDNSLEILEGQDAMTYNRLQYWFARYVVDHPDDFANVRLEDGSLDNGGYVRRSQALLAKNVNEYAVISTKADEQAQNIKNNQAAQALVDTSTLGALGTVLSNPGTYVFGPNPENAAPAAAPVAAKPSTGKIVAGGIGLGALAWYGWRWFAKGGL